MIRLAVIGLETKWREMGLRLRGATIEMGHDFSRDPAPPIACDAALVIEPMQPESELVERCLSARKHVLLVVDSWLSSDVLERLSVMARQSGVQFAVVNPERFLPSRQLVRQQLDSGKLGDPGLVRIHRWEPATAANRTKLELATSLLRDLELAVSFMGKSPNLVFAVESLPKDRDISSGRMIQLHLGFPGGGMALIDFAGNLPPGDDYASLSVIGSAGAAYADDHQNMQLVYRGSHPQAVRMDERGRQLVPMVQEFVDGLRTNQDFSWSVAAWRNVLVVADAVRRSLVERCAIEVEV